MRNAVLEEAQAGIKIAGRNINNLRYALPREDPTSLVAQMVKNPPAMQEILDQPENPGRENPLQYSCLENPHGQRSLAGYNLWDCKE